MILQEILRSIKCYVLYTFRHAICLWNELSNLQTIFLYYFKKRRNTTPTARKINEVHVHGKQCLKEHCNFVFQSSCTIEVNHKVEYGKPLEVWVRSCCFLRAVIRLKTRFTIQNCIHLQMNAIKKLKSLQHWVFPGGLRFKYWPSPMPFDLVDLTGCRMFIVVWP